MDVFFLEHHQSIIQAGMPREIVWLVIVTAAVVKSVDTSHLQNESNDPTPGMILLEELIANNTEALCKYVKCQEPLDVTECPENSVYLDGAGQFGCCGACVSFKKSGEANCTGSIDPAYGGDYTTTDSVSGPDVLHNSKDSFDHSNYVSSSWCDFGLKCNSTQMCEAGGEAEGGCLYIRQQYNTFLNTNYVSYRDDYRWAPNCTPHGGYAELQRKGPLGEEMHVCVDSAGNTIYGRIFQWQEDLLINMNCKCSRRVWEQLQAGEPSVTLHCMENGNYEELQCEDGWCYCVHSESGTPYSTILPEEAMQFLPCYNETLVGEQYLRRCDSISEASGQLTYHMLSKGVYGPAGLYKCDPDGSFSGEQCLHGECQCYDKYLSTILKASSGGGCNCARDQWLYSNEGNSHVKLYCASPSNKFDAGVYYTLQYYGDIGVYCVDQDGVRTSPMVYSEYVDHLDCEEAAKCQNGDNDACEKACLDCEPDFFVKYSTQE